MKPVILTTLLISASFGLTLRALDLPVATFPDGPFAPAAAQTTIDLGAATVVAWDGQPESAGVGVYDETKWAVVYKYKSVNIPANVTVRFKNNVAHAPVVWLVEGDVNINGHVILDGQDGGIDGLTQPGPGGFRGGRGRRDDVENGSGGFGPGGGNLGWRVWEDRSQEWNAGGYGTVGMGIAKQGKVYGNASVLPLIGGSGAGGVFHDYNDILRSGGAGGGAILIAAKGTITINGVVSAQGGKGGDLSAGGSGGAVRLLAERLAGTGTISARGGPNVGGYTQIAGGSGRIRLETKRYAGSLAIFPASPIVAPEPVKLWPDSTAPVARIISVGGVAVPSSVNGGLGPEPADITLSTSGNGNIVVQTENLDLANASVIVRIVPRNGFAVEVPAVLQSGTKAQATWLASSTFHDGFCALQVRAVTP